jgi:GH15 family glucan-1,4-alpha-glucosidase
MGGYRAINEYGLIGDCRTAALVGPDGSIDWFCWPRFDSDALFARLLDAERGGAWRVGPAGAQGDGDMRYRAQTAVLETEHATGRGTIRVVDAAPAPEFPAHGRTRIMRFVEGLAGQVEVESLFDPRPGFGEIQTRSLVADRVAEVSGEGFFARLALAGGEPTVQRAGEAICHRFTVRAGERVALMLVCGEGVHELIDVERAIAECAGWWEGWCERCGFEGEHAEAVLRSAITLKLLTHQDVGAMVAAATTSLPEEIGGERNWDYRYTWLRDASLTVYALLATEQSDAAEPFMRWVCDRVGAVDDVEELHIMYALDGSSDIAERTIEHFHGYRGSRPVRIGNRAIEQLQLDVYGEVLECLRVCQQSGLDFTGDVWPDFRRVVDWVAANWRRPDNGIWEMRGERRNFVYSKVMAWVALDRGISMGRQLGDDVERWRDQARRLRDEVLERGWSEQLGAFKQSYEDELLDAANLQIPVVGFLAPDDPRVHATIDATLRDLTDQGLVYRYRGADDGLAGGEGTFAICTFWLVSALARCGRGEEGRRLFDNALRFAGPLGLYGEEIDPQTGQALGNYPQAFTHIGLIGAAVDLARADALGARVKGVPGRRLRASEQGESRTRGSTDGRPGAGGERDMTANEEADVTRSVRGG